MQLLVYFKIKRRKVFWKIASLKISRKFLNMCYEVVYIKKQIGNRYIF